MAEKLIVELTLQPKSEKSAFDKVVSDAKNAGSEAGNEAGKGFVAALTSKIKEQSKSVGKTVAVTAAAVIAFRQLASTISSNIENLRDFERSVAEINSILPKNAKLTEAASQKFIQFSSSFGSNAATQAKAFYSIVSAGVQGTTKQLDVLNVANKAAVAGLVSIDQSATALVSSVNAYKKAGLTAKQASDQLFVAVKEGQTTFGELAASIGVVAPIAASAGVEFSSITGALASITKSGVKTNVAATGLRQVFVSVIKPTKEAADEAKRLGLEFNTTALRTKGLANFLKDLKDKTGGNEDSLAKLFGSVEALTPILQTINGDFKDFVRIQNETKNATGATNEAFKEIKKNIDFKINQLNSEVAALGLNLARVLNPALEATVDAIGTLAKIANRGIFGNKPVTEIDIINSKITASGKEFNRLKDVIANLESKKGIFGFGFDARKYKQAKDSLQDVIAKRKMLLKERADILNKQKMMDAEKALSTEENNNRIIASEKSVSDQIKELGVNTSKGIIDQENMKLQRLQELRDQELIRTSEYEQAKLQIQAQSQQQLLALEEQRVAQQSINFETLSKAFEINAKKTKLSALDLARTISTTFAAGFGRTFQSIGKAMRNGQNAFDAFKDGVNQLFADLASSIGDFYIKKGIALSLDPTGGGAAVGGPLIAAGAGLKLLSGVLGGSSSSSSGGSGVSSGGSFDNSLTDNNLRDEPEIAKAEKKTEIIFNVEGSLVQQQELAQFVNEISNEFNAKEGLTQIGANFA